MRKGYFLIIILQVIFALIIITCKNKNNEMIEIEVENVYIKETTELYDLFINESSTEIDSSEEYIIKKYPFLIFYPIIYYIIPFSHCQLAKRHFIQKYHIFK
jgi:hypothetical protein